MLKVPYLRPREGIVKLNDSTSNWSNCERNGAFNEGENMVVIILGDDDMWFN